MISSKTDKFGVFGLRVIFIWQSVTASVSFVGITAEGWFSTQYAYLFGALCLANVLQSVLYTKKLKILLLRHPDIRRHLVVATVVGFVGGLCVSFIPIHWVRIVYEVAFVLEGMYLYSLISTRDIAIGAMEAFICDGRVEEFKTLSEKGTRKLRAWNLLDAEGRPTLPPMHGAPTAPRD